MNGLTKFECTHYLLDQEGTLWFFYLSENQRIGYATNIQGDWSTHKYIDSQPIKGYSVTLDSKGIIRLIAYTTTRQLVYYEFLEGKWNSQVVDRIYSRYQDIPYYFILSSALGVHILYYINHSLSRSGETMAHYYLQGGKWNGGRVWKFVSDQMTVIHTPCIDNNNNLQLLFTQRWRNKDHLYHCIYDHASLSWMDPVHIHSSLSAHSYRIFAGSADDLHILWLSEGAEEYRIHHLLRPESVQDNSNPWQKLLIHETPHSIETPVMTEADDGLSCFWKEDRLIYRRISTDLGKTWSPPQSIRESMNCDATLLNFTYLDNGAPKSLSLWGQGYPELKLMGIKDEFLPGKTQAQDAPKAQLSPWDPDPERKDPLALTDIKRAITSIRRKNNSLGESIKELSAQVDRLNSLVYTLQEQMQINDRSLFNIHAQLKQLDFQIKQLQLRSRQVSTRVYDANEKRYKPLPITLDQDGKIQVENSLPQIDTDPDNDSRSAVDDLGLSEGGGAVESSENQPAANGDVPREEDTQFAGDSGIQDEDSPEINNSQGNNSDREIERITLGNTTILINPENQEDF